LWLLHRHPTCAGALDALYLLKGFVFRCFHMFFSRNLDSISLMHCIL